MNIYIYTYIYIHVYTYRCAFLKRWALLWVLWPCACKRFAPTAGDPPVLKSLPGCTQTKYGQLSKLDMYKCGSMQNRVQIVPTQCHCARSTTGYKHIQDGANTTARTSKQSASFNRDLKVKLKGRRHTVLNCVCRRSCNGWRATSAGRTLPQCKERPPADPKPRATKYAKLINCIYKPMMQL